MGPYPLKCTKKIRIREVPPPNMHEYLVQKSRPRKKSPGQQKNKIGHNSATKGSQGPKMTQTYWFLKPQVPKKASQLENASNPENQLFKKSWKLQKLAKIQMPSQHLFSHFLFSFFLWGEYRRLKFNNTCFCHTFEIFLHMIAPTRYSWGVVGSILTQFVKHKSVCDFI